MLLRNIMKKDVVTVSPDSSIREAARLMKKNNIGYLLVVDNGRLEGCFTDRDIVTGLADGKDLDGSKVSEFMKTDVITVSPDTDTFDASKIMAKNKIRRLPVLENNRISGIVSSADIATVLEEEVENFFHVEEAYHH